MKFAHELAVVLAAATLFCSVARAEGVPRYDVEAYCDDVADVSGGSAMIKNGCMDMEQENYNELKRGWPSIPVQTRSYCEEVAEVSGGSYMILKGCVDMELENAETPRKFKY